MERSGEDWRHTVVGELIERMQDENATFTAAEVKSLIDWYCKCAVSDEMRAIAERNEKERTRLLAEKTDNAMSTILAQLQHETAPTLQAIRYE